MADTFARISTEARYVVHEAGQEPVSVARLREMAETKRQSADAVESSVAGLKQSVDAANVGLAASYAALEAAKAEAKVLQDQWDFSDASHRVEGGAAPAGQEGGAGSKRSRPPAAPSRPSRSAPPPPLVEANTRVAAAKSAVAGAQASARTAEQKLRQAEATVRTDRARAVRFDSIAAEISAAEELVPVTLEEEMQRRAFGLPRAFASSVAVLLSPPQCAAARTLHEGVADC